MYNGELQMLREFFLLHAPETKCFFCGEPLYLPAKAQTFGHRRHTKIHERVFTVHHDDENRENNARTNLKDAHSSCHRRYHKQNSQGGSHGKESEERQEEKEVTGVSI